jgi:hypothetical protein
MALNIPVNLMSVIASHTPASTVVGKSDATEKIQPATSTENAGDAAAGGTTGERKNLANPSEEKSEKDTNSNTEHIYPSELDRYAPPNPLPTAPILQAAAAYAASRKETE